MTVRIAISFLVLLAAAAHGQQSAMTTINNVRSSIKSATAPVNERRDAALRQASGSTVAASIPSRLPEKPKQPVSSTPVSGPGEQKASAPVHVMQGKRDPFVSIIRTATVPGGCATGKKCLIIGQLELKGIVRTANGTIAVVQNAERKTYFLHENDPVFNGKLVKIEPDQVVFRETVVDRAGRQSSRDIIKRIFKPAV